MTWGWRLGIVGSMGVLAVVVVLAVGSLHLTRPFHGTPCSEVASTSRLLVEVPPPVLAATVTVQVGLCQEDRCGHVVFPASGHTSGVTRGGARFAIDLAGFHTAYDGAYPAEVTVILIGGRATHGAALVRQADDFRFDTSYPNGKGCAPEVLGHTEVVTAAQAPA